MRPAITFLNIQLSNSRVINPGSLSYPRQPGRKPSYIMMELEREGEAHFTIHYL